MKNMNWNCEKWHLKMRHKPNSDANCVVVTMTVPVNVAFLLIHSGSHSDFIPSLCEENELFISKKIKIVW